MFAGSKFSTLLDSFRALARPQSVADQNPYELRAAVTKAELTALFDVNSTYEITSADLLASERQQRLSTEMIRGAMYRAD